MANILTRTCTTIWNLSTGPDWRVGRMQTVDTLGDRIHESIFTFKSENVMFIRYPIEPRTTINTRS